MGERRIQLRPMNEGDRTWFSAALRNEEFMAFSAGVAAGGDADAWCSRFIELNRTIGFAKQPVVERASGRVLGYCGVGPWTWRGRETWEMGWRLVPEARGKGYASEAARVMLERAAAEGAREVWAIIDPLNEPSKRVARAVGFEFRCRAVVDGYLDQLYRWSP